MVTVQNINKIDGRLILSFLDVASRDKAQDLFNKNSAQNVFRSVSVPQKQFPALVRFRELQGISHLKGIENKDVRVAQENDLKRRLIADNPSLRGHLESVRVLHQPPTGNSFLVRIAFSSKPFCEQLIKSGRVLLDGVTMRLSSLTQEKKCGIAQSSKIMDISIIFLIPLPQSVGNARRNMLLLPVHQSLKISNVQTVCKS